MFVPLKELGSIQDCSLSVRWDAGALAALAERRAAALSRIRIGQGSVVATLHGDYLPHGLLWQR